jgi:hypothetical protein
METSASYEARSAPSSYPTPAVLPGPEFFRSLFSLTRGRVFKPVENGPVYKWRALAHT